MTTTPYTPAPATEDQILGLSVGDRVRHYINGQPFGDWREITSISYRGRRDDGTPYVGFYTTFGENATISGSIAAGECYYGISIEC